MPLVRFTGRVLPGVREITIGGLPRVTWTEGDRKVDLEIGITKNAVTVDCTVEDYDKERDLTYLYKLAHDMAQGSVDMVAFAEGEGLTLALEEVAEPSGRTSKLRPTEPSVPAICTAFGSNRDFQPILQIVLSDHRLRWALHDLVEAITIPNKAPLNCARSIETLRHVIAPDLSRKDAWERLRSELQISEAYLRLITDTSKGWRHGEAPYVDAKTSKDILERGWAVMNRYLEYKKRGSKQLSLADFPLLDEPA